jgi:uncharacterized protein (TIGR02145 family)
MSAVAGPDYVDPRDQKIYHTVILNGYAWFARNLDYEASDSKIYQNVASNETIYGRLYPFNVEIPAGCHLPTHDELANMCVWAHNTQGVPGELDDGVQLKSTYYWQSFVDEYGHSRAGVNSVGFNGLPAGGYDETAMAYRRIEQAAYFWLQNYVDTNNIWHFPACSLLYNETASFDGDINSSTYCSIRFMLQTQTPTIALGSSTSGIATISCTTSDAVIHYTTDGSTPTTSSTTYGGPITITTSATIKAIATSRYRVDSDVASTFYELRCLAPVIDPDGGSYNNSCSVSLSTSSPGAHVVYSADGSDPSINYSTPFDVTSTNKVRAVSCRDGWTTSVETDADFTIVVPAATPYFTPGAGIYSVSKTVWIRSATTNATIYYTTDNSTPTTSSTQYSTPLTVSASTTLKAIAVATGYLASAVGTAIYTLACATPKISLPSGTYVGAPTTTISCATSDAVIHYTTDGSDPSVTSSVYSSKLTITNSGTLQAIAIQSGWTSSSIVSAVYVLKCATPTISLDAGSYTGDQYTTISCTTSDASIYYTTDGSTPTTSSTSYSSQFKVPRSCTLKVLAVKSNCSNSDVASAVYVLTCDTPTFSVKAGTYRETFTTTISCATSDAVIHYTTDGSTPTASSAVYSTVLTISADTTLKAIAIESGWTSSIVVSAAYLIRSCADPTFSFPRTTTPYDLITLSCTTSDAVIHYTTDGSTPTTSSTTYSAPFEAVAGTIIKMLATKGSNLSDQSNVVSGTFVSDTLFVYDFSLGPRDLPNVLASFFD